MFPTGFFLDNHTASGSVPGGLSRDSSPTPTNVYFRIRVEP